MELRGRAAIGLPETGNPNELEWHPSSDALIVPRGLALRWTNASRNRDHLTGKRKNSGSSSSLVSAKRRPCCLIVPSAAFGVMTV